MTTLSKVKKPVANATAAPTIPKARHKGAKSIDEDSMEFPIQNAPPAPQTEGQEQDHLLYFFSRSLASWSICLPGKPRLSMSATHSS